MREYSFSLIEALKNGLRPDQRMGRNAPFLTEAFNIAVTERGVEVPDVPTNVALPEDVVISWPFPQLVSTTEGLLLFTADALWQPNLVFFPEGGWDKTLDIYETDRQFNVSYFGPWVIASSPCDAGWEGANVGSEVVHQAWFGEDVWWQWDAYRRVTGEAVYIPQNCHCNFRQRLVHSRWRSMQINWQPVGAVISNPPGMGDTREGFKARKGYTPLESALPTRVGYAGDDLPDDSPFRELGEISTRGLPRFLYFDRTLRLLPIEPAGGFIAYTNLGVSAHILHVQPIPTFGRIDLSKGIGCAGWFLAQCNDTYTRHVWIDSFGDIWTIDGNGLKLTKLGYKEYIQPMMAAETSPDPFYPGMIIVYSKRNDAFFITNGTKCYMLSVKGLTEVGFCPTSIIPCVTSVSAVSGAEHGTEMEWAVFSPVIDNEARVASEMLDLGIRGIKTVSGLEVSSDTENLYHAISYRYKMGESFTDSRWKKFSRHGIGAPVVSGVDLKVKIKADDYTKFNIDGLTVKWKAADKRMIRGPYGTSHAKSATGEGS